MLVSGKENMSKRPRPTIWQTINRYPPILVRLLARKSHGAALSTMEIAEISGLSPAAVEAISQTLSWDGITVSQLQSFLKGCKIDLFNPRQRKRIEVYLRGKMINGQRKPPNYRYLKKDPLWLTYYQPLMLRWWTSLQRKVE